MVDADDDLEPKPSSRIDVLVNHCSQVDGLLFWQIGDNDTLHNMQFVRLRIEVHVDPMMLFVCSIEADLQSALDWMFKFYFLELAKFVGLRIWLEKNKSYRSKKGVEQHDD